MINKISVNSHQIAYKIYGSPELSRVVFFMHGFPGSLEEAQFADEVSKRLGVSLIAPDRPGFGESETYENRNIIDWPDVIARIADELKIGKFSIIGVSGGAPYAAACAARLGERVAKLALVSAMAPLGDFSVCKHMTPPNRMSLWLAWAAPPIGALAARSIASWWRISPKAIMLWLGMVISKDDRRILTEQKNKYLFARNFMRALKPGTAGCAQEIKLLAGDWGFELDQIRVPTMIWHGNDDNYVPVDMARKLNLGIPNSELKLLPGRGHFMLVELAEELLQNVI